LPNIGQLCLHNAVLRKFPETGYDTFRDKACVYVLFGEDGDGNEKAYFGESISVDARLGTHAFSSKSWEWSDVFVFCRNDFIFGKTQMLYVEEQLILQANAAGRFTILNDGKNPRKGTTCTIEAVHQHAADEFIQSIQMLCSTFGYKLFEPLHSITDFPRLPADTGLPTFTTKASGRYKATGKLTGDGKTFVVFAGSTISPTETNTIPSIAKEKRVELFKSGIIKEFRFEQDCVFHSAWVAATVICGANVSAYTTWQGLEEFVRQQETVTLTHE
jgi:hypothetical protein